MIKIFFILFISSMANAATLEYDINISDLQAFISKLSNIGIYAQYDGKNAPNAYISYVSSGTNGRSIGHLELTIYTKKEEIPNAEVWSSSTSVILTDIDAEVTK